MATKVISSLILIGVVIVIISCFAELSFGNTIIDENSISLVINGLHEMQSSRNVSRTHDDLNVMSNVLLNRHSIEAIYQFGDSISDTGNFIWENPYSSFGQSPYGETFFHKPAGRCSDGLLIVDRLAQFLNLPLLNPALNKNSDFTHGANFAVIGATALDISTLIAKNIKSFMTNHSLSVQLDWFKSHHNSVGNNLAKSLVMMGEIGGNDYNFAIGAGKQPQDLYQMVPDVVQFISKTVEEIISLGVTQIIVPGNLPMGCMTVYLTAYKSNDPSTYDELKCIKALNIFAKFHDEKLRESLGAIQRQNPNVAIVFMDLHEAMKNILRNPPSLGFDGNVVYKVCCGNGDSDYNFNYGSVCGTNGVASCPNPLNHVNWDGWHLTDHANEAMTKWLFPQIFDTSF